MTKCYFCQKPTEETVSIWMGAGIVSICMACDDRMVQCSLDEEG